MFGCTGLGCVQGTACTPLSSVGAQDPTQEGNELEPMGSNLGTGSALVTGRLLVDEGTVAEMGGPGRGRMGTGFLMVFFVEIATSVGWFVELTTTITCNPHEVCEVSTYIC